MHKYPPHWIQVFSEKTAQPSSDPGATKQPRLATLIIIDTGVLVNWTVDSQHHTHELSTNCGIYHTTSKFLAKS